MKIVFPDTVTQFSRIEVKASKLMMGELLHVINGDFSPSAAVYAQGMEEDNWSVVLASGAKLYYNHTQKTFFLYCYHYSGKDGVAAVEQLKFADSVRMARKRLAAMHEALGTFKPPRLRVLFEYGHGNQAAM